MAAPLLAQIKAGEDGAVCLFDGIVRNHTRNRRTLYLEYDSYPAMAMAGMERLAMQALAGFPVRDVRIVHRVGRLEIGETSVVIVVASAHRAAAFDACRWIIDTLKKTVPIWKKEFFADGATWADGEPFPTGSDPVEPWRGHAPTLVKPSRQLPNPSHSSFPIMASHVRLASRSRFCWCCWLPRWRRMRPPRRLRTCPQVPLVSESAAMPFLVRVPVSPLPPFSVNVKLVNVFASVADGDGAPYGRTEERGLPHL